MAAVARLERATKEGQEQRREDRQVLQRLDGEVRGLQTQVASVEKLGVDIQAWKSVLNFLKIFAVAAVVSFVGFVVDGVRQREKVEAMQAQLIELKEKYEMMSRALNMIGMDVRSMSTELKAWREAEERRVNEAERRLEKIEEKRRR